MVHLCPFAGKFLLAKVPTAATVAQGDSQVGKADLFLHCCAIAFDGTNVRSFQYKASS